RLRRGAKSLLRRRVPSYSPNGGFPLGLMGRDETNADHGAAARAAERRQRRFGLPERRHEPETIRLRHAALALGAAKLTTIKLGVGRLQVGEADSLLSSHLTLPPWPPGPSSSVRHPAPGRCRRSGIRRRMGRAGREGEPLAAERHL